MLETIFIWAVPLLFAITLHEYAHGWMAYRLGDGSAKMLGRLTLNPIKHIDPVGTILVPVMLLLMPVSFIFGWAKPVPVNFNALNNPKRDMFWVAIAGPVSNIIMAIDWLIVAYIANWLDIELLSFVGAAGVFVNLLLAIFNLLPLPPLDGGRVLSALLPKELAFYYDKIEPYGFFILIALLFLGVFQLVILPILSSILIFLSDISSINLIDLINHLING